MVPSLVSQSTLNRTVAVSAHPIRSGLRSPAASLDSAGGPRAGMTLPTEEIVRRHPVPASGNVTHPGTRTDQAAGSAMM